MEPHSQSGRLRPVKRPSGVFETQLGGEDPAIVTRIAHDSALALLNRVRASDDPELVTRLAEFADGQGIDALAELWAHAAPRSLPGALWRMYLLRAMIVQDAQLAAMAYERGSVLSTGIDAVIAGAAAPTGPEEVRELADAILRGVFSGDFAVALERAAACARVCSVGFVDLAHDADGSEPERASQFTIRAARLSSMAAELVSCARLWRLDQLD